MAGSRATTGGSASSSSTGSPRGEWGGGVGRVRSTLHSPSPLPLPTLTMSLLEAVRLALAQIRVQKLKSFFTLLGVTIGVMFLIAVVSIVGGMSQYMENEFAAKLLGVNTFTLRRFPWFGDGAGSEEEWRAWLRRPQVGRESWR